jgi:hypothetical protein
MNYAYGQIERALHLLDGRLWLNESSSISVVVCGGAALNALTLIERTTKDVDIVALMDSESRLIDPAPLPEELIIAATEVADTLNLPENWLNNGPSSGDGGLFRLGLPDGFSTRLVKSFLGRKLTVYYVGRLDQIHFKLYAAIDQHGGYHAADLKQLDPTDEELLLAVNWTVKHDPSEGFKIAIKLFLQEFGYERLVEKM